MFQIYSPEEDSFLLAGILEKEIPKLVKEKPELTFLEIGSGSGIQLETAKKSGIKKKNILGCDINKTAVKACKELGFNCMESNLFSKIKGKFDLIIFNPPYLPEDTREPKESQIATTGGKKGNEITQEFLKQAKYHLKAKGKIFLLTSSFTKDLDLSEYSKKLLKKEKLFCEELDVWELSP